jgi:hypothetical protein
VRWPVAHGVRLGTNPVCTWLAPDLLAVDLGSGASLLLGANVSFLSGALTDPDGAALTQLSSPLTLARSAEEPVAVISGPAKAGSCESVTLDTGLSTGNAGRAWTRREWQKSIS